MFPRAPRVESVIIMTTVGRFGIGVPVMLLHEGEGLTVMVETKLGETYRGVLFEAEDNMNMFMKAVTYTDADGKVSKLEQVYLRGNQISLVTFPDILTESPIFERVRKHKESNCKFTAKNAH